MKNHTQKVTELLYSSRPAENIDLYVKKMSKKNDFWWILTVIAAVIITFFFTKNNTPSRAQMITAAHPLIDSIQQEYQCKLDSCVNFVEQEHKIIR